MTITEWSALKQRFIGCRIGCSRLSLMKLTMNGANAWQRVFVTDVDTLSIWFYLYVPGRPA